MAQSFYSKTAIMITWDLLPASVSHGIVLGYEIHVKEVTSDADLPEDLLEEWILIENASQTSFRFGNLSLATKYQVQMAAYTSKGVGPLSDFVYAGKSGEGEWVLPIPAYTRGLRPKVLDGCIISFIRHYIR